MKRRLRLMGWYILRGLASVFTLCLLARWLLPMAMAQDLVGSGCICWVIIALTVLVWAGTGFLTKEDSYGNKN